MPARKTDKPVKKVAPRAAPSWRRLRAQAQHAEGSHRGAQGMGKKRGKPKQLDPAAIHAIFSRLRDANPEPKGELEYVNPLHFACRRGAVRAGDRLRREQATRGLFAAADTPQKMVALGEDKVRDYIKTIGLFRTKAKNVVALSEKLIADYNGEIPRSREELEKLPGVGRKTANVVLNIAFGEETIAVDTHLFRLSNRLRLAPGKNPARSRTRAAKGHPEGIHAARAPLADPARTLHLQGDKARMREMRDRRTLHIAGQAHLRLGQSMFLLQGWPAKLAY